ncbi:saccharopine dehydrogenase family protein [Brevundimonas sp.]|uniref:saccharopine dehydrogenase family protein n=1 Tax=Brevundimonas sp. TaxID=1871086 RepID=UPI002BA7BF92|nr:saccharopine dehydrogenase NADP-binding domain-containing protein [Brevundimonas sp.]HWQ87221.1 saccharopine dehydrogenase NADP-binding domain-containing protein [Brevundimonas sp.]
MPVQEASSSVPGDAVAVFGAAGHTGRFVVAELLRRGFTPIAIGRDAARLAGSGFAQRSVETRVATVADPVSLDRALAGVLAVINCAGPFLDTAEPLAAAAIRARIPYLDVSAEQGSARTLFERFGSQAEDTGVILVPAMAFYGGLADLLATAAMGDWTTADGIEIGIALDSWRPTRGTRITGQRNTTPRLFISNGRLEPLPTPAPEMSRMFPAPFGVQEAVELSFSETILIARHLRAAELHTWLNLAPLRDLRDAGTPPPAPTDDSGRSAQTFAVEAVVRKGAETRRASASGRDIYAVTAPLVVEAVQRILSGEIRKCGAFAPGEIFDAACFLRALSPEHLALDIAGG